MKRLSRKLALWLALSLAVPVIVAPACAHDGPAAAAKAKAAASALQAYADRARKAGHRPDFAAAPASDLLHAVFDAGRFAALPEPAGQDMAWLLDWADAANGSYKQMIMVGLTPGKAPDEAIVGRNMAEYEEQIAPAMSFLIRALAREMTASMMFLLDLPKEQLTPVRMDGFRGFRASGGEFLQSALCVVAKDMKPASARMVMAAVSDTRDVWQEVLFPDDRARVMDWLKQIAANASDKDVADTAAGVLATFAAAK